MSSESLVLSDIAAPIKNAIVGGPFGSNLVSKDYVEHGVPVIRGQNMGDKWVSGEFVYVSEEKAQALSQNTARPGDLVFTQRGTLGQVSIVQRGRFDKYIVSQSQMKITVDPEKADVTFLYYLFKTPEQLQYIFNSAIQTGVPHTNLGILKATPVQLPPLSVQKQISAVMNCLDDRITLLRETNATLEAIAQALFKSWFVDFDPVHAKQQGRAPEGMDEATAALFPDSFEESELGLVPKGWRVGSLADLATYLNGYAFKTKDWQETGHPVVKIGNVKPGIIDVAGATCVSPEVIIELDRFRLKRGDLLVGMTGYVGETGLVTEIEPAAYLNQRVGKISTKKSIDDLAFVFCLVRNPAYKAHAEAKSHGSAQANVSGADLMSYPTVLPDSEVLDAFNQMLAGLLYKILGNHEQAKTLATLRDTLLPRLISGQLRLPEAEAMIEHV